jgi:hypothetical protein
MNTVGKTLVGLNFLFAVIVGGFLVFDFATRSDWKSAYESLNRQVTILKADRDTAFESLSDAINKKKEAEAKFDNQKVEMDDKLAKAGVDLTKKEAELADAKIAISDLQLTTKKAAIDVKRLEVVEADLRKIIKNREETILTLQDKNNKLATAAIASEQLAKSVADRNQELLKQLQEQIAENQKIRLTGGASGAPGITVKSAGADLNPPTALVKGRIERVDPTDKTLVEISLGTDQGVNKNNTLEVFRTSPEPKYLGVIRIVDANFNRSVGRLVVAPGSAVRPQLQVGDHAWSYLK